MSNYEEEITRLHTIIDNADDSEQINTAQAVLDRLHLDAANEHVAAFRARTAQFTEKMAQLKIIIDGIQANQLTGAIDKLDSLLAEIKTAADEAAGEDPA